MKAIASAGQAISHEAPPPHSRYAELQLPDAARDVATFWTFEADGEPHRILPDGCIDFIFDLDTGEAVAVGSMTGGQLVQPERGSRSFGVRFAPGAAAVLLDAHAAELTDTRAPLDAISRAGQFRLGERVAQAGSDDERARLLVEFMGWQAARLRPRDPRVRRAADLIRDSAGRAPVATIAEAVGIGERQLERLFAEHVGTRPKLLARVFRMQHTLAQLEQARAAHAAHAQDAGYADEPHLIREFRALTGVTPGRLLLERRVGIVQADSAARS